MRVQFGPEQIPLFVYAVMMAHCPLELVFRQHHRVLAGTKLIMSRVVMMLFWEAMAAAIVMKAMVVIYNLQL